MIPISIDITHFQESQPHGLTGRDIVILGVKVYVGSRHLVSTFTGNVGIMSVAKFEKVLKRERLSSADRKWSLIWLNRCDQDELTS